MYEHFTIRPFEKKDAECVTTFWRESMSEAVGIDPIHAFEAHRFFLTEILPQNYALFVAATKDSDTPVALMAVSSEEINQLYVDREYQGQGIGADLLEFAKQKSSGSLWLRTFEVNQKAQRFYERYGFVAIGGDSNNEEGLPDILYEWRRCEA